MYLHVLDPEIPIDQGGAHRTALLHWLVNGEYTCHGCQLVNQVVHHWGPKIGLTFLEAS
jgi:hypothetical protein